MAKFVFIVFFAIFYTCESKNVGTHPIIPFKEGDCLPSSQMMKNFQPEKFFTGTWYERSSFDNDLTEADGECSALSSKIVGDKVEMMFSHFVSFPFSRYNSVQGVANLDDTKSASFNLDMSYLPGLNIKHPIGVLDTDYDSYAVIYSCQKVEAHLSDEMVWTYVRHRGDASNDGRVERVLKLSGFKPDSFNKYDLTKQCPAGEPTL